MIKVCINPHCDEVAHNIAKSETRCRNCDFRLITIDEDTYLKKFVNNTFQVDYTTGERITPKQMGYNVQLKLSFNGT
jgi:hypothetical protein